MSVKGRGAILMEGVLNRAEANADGKKIKKAFATSRTSIREGLLAPV